MDALYDIITSIINKTEIVTIIKKIALKQVLLFFLTFTSHISGNKKKKVKNYKNQGNEGNPQIGFWQLVCSAPRMLQDLRENSPYISPHIS